MFSQKFNNPFELFCESALGGGSHGVYPEVSEAEFANLIAESAMAGANLIAESNTAGMEAALRCSRFQGNKNSNAYVTLIAESATGVIGRIWEAIKKVFHSIVNFIKGLLGKFSSGDGTKVVEDIAAIKAKVDSLANYKVAGMDTAKVELQKHKPAAALTAAVKLLDSNSYIGFVPSTSGSSSSPCKEIGESTTTGTPAYIQSIIENVLEDKKVSKTDDAAVKNLSTTINAFSNAFSNCDNNSKNQDRWIASIIAKTLSGTAEDKVDFTWSWNKEQNLSEEIKKTFFDTETKKYTGVDIDNWVTTIKTTLSGITDLENIKDILVKGQKEFSEITDGWDKLEDKVEDKKNEMKTGDNESGQTERAQALSSFAGSMTMFSKLVSLLNGSIIKGFTLGNDLSYKSVQSLKNQVDTVEKVLINKGIKNDTKKSTKNEGAEGNNA
ncbi:MAG: hypothetical protein ACRCZ9_12025 [Fusobacteriaceae bacterium]